MSDDKMRLVPDDVLERLDDMMCHFKADGSVLLSESVANEHGEDLQALLNAYRALSTRDEVGPVAVDMRAVCDALGFDPTNHHNAAKCPYCAPVGPVAGEVKPVAWPETLDWSMVDSGAICHWRASFGDYVLDVVQGHDLVWAYRVNNTGRMNFDGLESATAAAVEDLRGRLLIRWAAAQKTMRLYAAPPATQDDALRIAVEALERIEATPRDRFQVKRMKRYAAEALAALKSTAGQEGGK